MDFALRTTIRTVCAVVSLWCCFAASAGAAAPAPIKQTAWAQLSTQQRKALAPLATEWDAMQSYRQKKWLGIAERYDTMTPEEQGRMQHRMQDWVKLAPEERRQAREKYKALRNVAPEQRESLLQNWEDYKALPEAEKKRLKDTAVSRPQIKTMPASPSITPLRQ
jgi:Skp family chaperone for outer membrane proteins